MTGQPMEPLDRYEGIPEVWARITQEREAFVQFPYPLTRPHLEAYPRFRGQMFAASQVTVRWKRFSIDQPWRLVTVIARGRHVKHNGRLSGAEDRESVHQGADLSGNHALPPLLAAIVAEYGPKED